jgi:glucan phosphoethanolaminetransferase (alkaline phosphatase superfamily)
MGEESLYLRSIALSEAVSMVATQERNSAVEGLNPFRTAGFALITVGLLDIGVMIYSVMNRLNYSSSLNILAVIAGIFLLKGGVKTARAVRWLSAMTVIASAGVILFTPFLTPVGLLLVKFQINPLQTVGSSLLVLLSIAFLAWLYLQLSKPASLQVLKQAGCNVNTPKSACIAGVILVLVIVGITLSLKNSPYADRAKSLASEQLGGDYHYRVTRMSISGDSGRAVVTAYNEQEIKEIEVAW